MKFRSNFKIYSKFFFSVGFISIVVGLFYVFTEPRFLYLSRWPDTPIHSYIQGTMFLCMGVMFIYDSLKSKTDRENLKYDVICLKCKKLHIESTDITRPCPICNGELSHINDALDRHENLFES